MKNSTPVLFPVEPMAPSPPPVDLTTEIMNGMAALLLQVLEITEEVSDEA